MAGHDDVTVEIARNDVRQRLNCKDYTEAVENFSKVAGRYEQTMMVLGWPGPYKVAIAADALLKGKSDAKILDVGAGTGMIGVELSKRGYTRLDAVDASEAMLERAAEKKIYQNIICHEVGDVPMPFDDNSYDMAVSCGAFAENFIPIQGLDDTIRVVKPGGYVINTTGIVQEEWFSKTFISHMERLEKDGLWRLVSIDKYPGFLDAYEGRTFVHIVL